MIKDSKLIFISLLAIFLFGLSLNYIVKSPNDGTLYNLAAKYFLETGIFKNPTTISSTEFFPTTQIAAVFILIFFMFVFGNFWLFFYALALSYLWILVFKKIKFFIQFYFLKNNLLVFIFTFLLFFNYDYLISSTSFYNEAFYYPLLIFFLVKIIHLIEQKKDLYQYNYPFILFLVFGVSFRVQHFALICALLLFYVTQKNMKNILITTLIFFCSLAIFYLSFLFIVSFNDSSTHIILNNNENYTIYSNLQSLLKSFDIVLIIKNLKVHLSIYTHFLNLPKIMDFTLPNNFSNLTEILYLFVSILIISFFILGILKNKNQNVSIILLFFLFFNSIFVFLLNDVTTRYLLPTNFVILYFLLTFLISNKNLLKKIFIFHKSFKFIVILIIILMYSTIAYNYFTNKNIQSNYTYQLNMLIKEFNNNRQGNYPNNLIFVGRTNYVISWWTSLPMLSIKNFFELIFNDSTIKDTKQFYYVGSKTDFILEQEEFQKKYQVSNKILKLEDYSYLRRINNDISIWKIFIE